MSVCLCACDKDGEIAPGREAAFGWRIHGGVEDTELSNKNNSFSLTWKGGGHVLGHVSRCSPVQGLGFRF